MLALVVNLNAFYVISTLVPHIFHQMPRNVSLNIILHTLLTKPMTTLIFLFALANASAKEFQQPRQQCTTIGVTAGATDDHSTLVTHTADCKDCDFRLSKTLPQTHDLDKNPNRPVYQYKNTYPRLVADDRGETWKTSNLETDFIDQFSDQTFIDSQVVGYIPQVPHTYGLFESLFGIMNDQQVAIGESTCAARFGLEAVKRPCPTCEGPLFEMTSLSMIALERCDTAKCAVKTMGDLAVEFGFYGGECRSPFFVKFFCSHRILALCS